MPFYQFKKEQQVSATLPEMWAFISSPANLKLITPPYMGFDIIMTDLPEKMYQGMMIDYTVSPVFGIKLRWLTEITHLKEMEYFVDEQRAGPYALWHHQHLFTENENGVLMKDIVTYKPPMGFLGAIANALIIEKKLNEIFSFRRSAIEQYFPTRKHESNEEKLHNH